MVRSALIVIIFTALAAAANAQNDGGLVAPELSKPTPGHLLDQDYLTSTGRDRPTARGSARVGSNAARPPHRAAE